MQCFLYKIIGAGTKKIGAGWAIGLSGLSGLLTI